jgi:hypothetical protein
MGNEIQKWIDEDKELSKLLTDIQLEFESVEEQAIEAFHKVTSHFNLPLMPEDKGQFENEYEQRGVVNPRSVFEEYTVLNFLAPDDDPRGRVLSAIFHVKQDIQVDYHYVAEKQFGSNIPKELLIGMRGEGLKGELIFPLLEGKTWTQLGCKFCVKYFKDVN